MSEKLKKFWAEMSLYGMEKESVVLSFPKKLKRASEMFEKDGKKWKAKLMKTMLNI